MTTWQLWLHLDLDYEAVFGAIGEHACASAGNLLRNAVFANEARRLDGPPTATEHPCVVAVDAPLVLAEPEIVREVPRDAGCVLVAPYDFPDSGVVDARRALGKRPAWVALAHSAISGEFMRMPPMDLPFSDTESVSLFLPFAMQCRAQLARVCVRRNDAFLNSSVHWGHDDEQAITGRSLAKALAPWSWSDWNYHGRFWRRTHLRHFLWVDGPILPGFRALLDALPPHRSGAPRNDIEVICDDDMEPWDERTIWRVVRVEWLVMRFAVSTIGGSSPCSAR